MKNGIGNNNNLIPIACRTPAERKAIARKGAERTNQIRRAKKTFKQELEILLTMEKDGRSMQELMSLSMINQAIKGNTKAYEVVRDTIGQKPVEQMAVDVNKNKSEAVELLENIKALKNKAGVEEKNVDKT